MITLQELIENADDAYYAMKYDQAVDIYKEALDLDSGNKHAREQIRKVELNRLSKDTAPINLPPEALQLYRRSRSFIAGDDLAQARKLLRRAVDIAEKSNMDFPNARELLKNIQNALKAEALKKKAFDEFDTQQWGKAESDLNAALDLDPTDDAIKVLLSHLRSLLKAQSLINILNAEGEQARNRSVIIAEVKGIINSTNEATLLSKLWQEVVKLFGECNKRKNENKNLIQAVGWSFVVSVILIIVVLSSLYLLPHRRSSMDCSKINGLELIITYPNYIANGDKAKIELTIKNVSDMEINGLIVVDFYGTAKVHLAEQEANKIKIENLVPAEQISSEIEFSLNELMSFISNPGYYVNFHAVVEGNKNICKSGVYHIALSPFYGMGWLITGLFSMVVAVITGLLKDRIKDFLICLIPPLAPKKNDKTG